MRCQMLRSTRRVALALLVILLVVLSVSACPAAQAAPPLEPAKPNRAGLLIQFGKSPSDIYTYCVSFVEPEISGDELLERSGTNPSFGTAGEVCRIGNVGCPAEDCFCACPFPNCTYWAYYHLRKGAWQYSQLGAMGSQLRNGDVDAWSWGEGADYETGGKPPPVLSFEQICPAETPTPTPPASTPPAPPPPVSIPEPSTLLLAAIGVAALGGFAKRAASRR